MYLGHSRFENQTVCSLWCDTIYVYLYGQTTSHFSRAKPSRLVSPFNHAGFCSLYILLHQSKSYGTGQSLLNPTTVSRETRDATTCVRHTHFGDVKGRRQEMRAMSRRVFIVIKMMRFSLACLPPSMSLQNRAYKTTI